MTDKPELSWYPTTIDELQRLLDSGVWPRVRAIADDVGPLQVVQGRLTYIDIEKDGMSGILREGPAPAGAEPFDLTSRSLWLWRAESSASSTPSGSALAVERLRAFDEALDKLERRAGHVSWQAFAAALQRWGTAASPMARSDVASALGSLADSWADELPKPEMLAERKNPRDADADAEVERLADDPIRAIRTDDSRRR